jgi:hypothetical protein
MLMSMEQDAKIWQTPALAMTAQAFLLTVALDSTSLRTARYLSAGLATMIALISMQLMAKHRFVGELDRLEAARLEEKLGLPNISSRRRGQPGSVVAPWILRKSSYRIWVVALGVFALTSMSILLITAITPDALSRP